MREQTGLVQARPERIGPAAGKPPNASRDASTVWHSNTRSGSASITTTNGPHGRPNTRDARRRCERVHEAGHGLPAVQPVTDLSALR